MTHLKPWLIGLTWTLCWSAASGIQFDKSCSGRQLDILREVFSCSFQKAQVAYDLTSNPLTGADATEGQYITHLRDDLFGDTARIGSTSWDPDNWIKARFAGDLNRAPLYGGDRRNYAGVLSVSADIGRGQPLGPDDVKVFCDTSRFYKKWVRKDDSKLFTQQWYDADRRVYLDKDASDPTAICSTFSGNFGLNFDMAQTYVPAGTPDDPRPYDTITVCPWFLQYMQKSNFPSCKRIQDIAKGLIAKWRANDVTAAFGFADIDLFSLPDKVMLHELTHTRAGGETVDVLLEGDDDDLSNKAYGWNNAKIIVNRQMGHGPAYNADTFALFAHGVSIINAGGMINDDGSLEDPPDPNTGPNVPRKRMVFTDGSKANGTMFRA